MVRRVVPFRAWHYDWLGAVAEPTNYVWSQDLRVALEPHNSVTGIVNGDVVFCAGTVPYWPTRHVAWTLLSPASARHMGWITREISARLAKIVGRIEMSVRVDYLKGQRWAELLGFRVETPLMPKYGPDGEDHVGYVRIN